MGYSMGNICTIRSANVRPTDQQCCYKGEEYLRYIAVSMTMHECSQLHHTPVPTVVCGGLAQHDLGNFGENLTHAFAACIGISHIGLPHADFPCITIINK